MSRCIRGVAVLFVMVSVCRADQDTVAVEAARFEGVWIGSWGGGERDGVVMQPVRAELVVRGSAFEASGLRNLGTGQGSLQVNPGQRTIVLEQIRAGRKESHTFRYAFSRDQLTLTDRENIEMRLERVKTEPNPHANLSVELVSASRFTAEGHLEVTRYTAVRAGRNTAPVYRPVTQVVSLDRGRVYLIEATSVQELSVTEARARLGEATPVVLAERPQPLPGSGALIETTGAIAPDSPEGMRTLQRLFRPGTLFVLVAESPIAP